MAVVQQFRTAMRGFNRQDVQDYIEQITAAHRQDLAGLQKRLEKSDRRVEELEETTSSIDAIADELSKARAGLDASNQTVGRLQGELSQAESKLTVAKQELERLRARVVSLEPMAERYVQLKDRVATVELDAHRKAQDTVSEAQAEAERVRAETREWLESVLAEYSQLRAGLDGVLDQFRRLADVPEKMEELDGAAKRLREQGGLKCANGV